MCENHLFEFDVDKAFADQLLARLSETPAHPIEAPEAPGSHGVYALFDGLSKTPSYVGVALGPGGIAGRLRDHVKKVSGRKGLDPKKITCRFLVLPREWEAMRAEDELIKRFHPKWNGIPGFSMHMPGSGRPGKPGYVNKWEEMYPPRA